MTPIENPPISRNARSLAIDNWLRANRGRVEREDPTVLAREMKRAGLYSAKTTLMDIRGNIRKHCSRLGLLCQARVLNH